MNFSWTYSTLVADEYSAIGRRGGPIITSIIGLGCGGGDTGLKLFLSLKTLRRRLSGISSVKKIAKLTIYLSMSLE
jgi:hypothetical protein